MRPRSIERAIQFFVFGMIFGIALTGFSGCVRTNSPLPTQQHITTIPK